MISVRGPVTERLRVLVVEHDQADAELCIAELRRGGFDVRAAVVQSPEQFAQQIRDAEFDVVLADYRLPQWSGMDALAALRAGGLDIPLILVTGTLSDERAVECVRHGAADYILKDSLRRLPVAVTRVLTERRSRLEAQHSLAESEARFRKLAEASFDAFAIQDEGVIREVNRGFVEMFGYDSDAEVVGRPATDFCAEESREAVARRIADEQEGTYEIVALRKDGTKIRVEVTAKLHSSGGRPGRIVALRDITARRALEDQFRQAQKMEAVGRLAGGVAHDFNNLLTVIGSYADLMLEQLGPDDPWRPDVEEIRSATTAAAGLTKQLLAFSRQQVVLPRRVALEDIVAKTEKMLRRLIGEDIALTTSLSSTPLYVTIDPSQLEHALMNLAVNARDAMPTGGELVITTAVVDLDDGFVRKHWPATPGRFASLAVRDTGVGMDEKTRSRVFEPFFTTKELGKGTGLGLATVYGIIKQSGGFIWVDSEPGRGSTFSIHLPLAAGSAEADDARPPSESPRGTETILIAEDAAPVRATARRILERLGYTVIEAPSGAAALEAAARTGPIDLLLTDVVMPEMSGRQLAERFAALRPGTRTLYMSGYTGDAVLLHGVRASGLAFLQKPFTPVTLAAKVREVLESRPETRDQRPEIAR